jgi:hypothetical protein
MMLMFLPISNLNAAGLSLDINVQAQSESRLKPANISMQSAYGH